MSQFITVSKMGYRKGLIFSSRTLKSDHLRIFHVKRQLNYEPINKVP